MNIAAFDIGGTALKMGVMTREGTLLEKGKLVVSPDCHTPFGYVFYDDMNKKPVAQPQDQHYLLGFRTVYGLLSLLRIAIVVNCFTLNTKS